MFRKQILDKKFKFYKVNNKDFELLLSKVDIIPPSLAIAQAAYESGFTQGLHLKLFGQRISRLNLE